MKHICDEKGCRFVSDEEYERIMKEKENEENQNVDKTQKPKSNTTTISKKLKFFK